MWWKKNRWKVILPVLVVVILAVAFWVGGDNPAAREDQPSQPVETVSPSPSARPSEIVQPSVEPDEESSCTISISCATILNNLDFCDPSKVDLIPEDGWILEPVVVTLEEGDSVFDVLQRICREHKIHLEFVDTTIYDTAYIEGIANIYEFDVGELSGWRYSVNGWFPNYGSSQYQAQDGDVIEWVYTCDLGNDLGSVIE